MKHAPAGSHRTRSHVHITRFLRVDDKGGCEMTARPPALRVGELAVELNLVIPTRLFAKPVIRAQVTIPDDAALPDRVAADVVQFVERSLADAIRVELQVDISPRPVTLAPPEPEA
jgi:hypothetical protein